MVPNTDGSTKYLGVEDAKESSPVTCSANGGIVFEALFLNNYDRFLCEQMPPISRTKQHAQVILDHIQDRVFPETEEIASAELSPDSWAEVASRIKEAREALEVRMFMLFSWM